MIAAHEGRDCFATNNRGASQRWEQPRHTLLYRTRAGSLHTLASSKALRESRAAEHAPRPTLWLELAFTIVLEKEL